MVSIKRPNLTNTKSQETGETISAVTHHIKSHPTHRETEYHFLEKMLQTPNPTFNKATEDQKRMQCDRERRSGED
jgi:outer membrane protein assembly factor BamD (BamD/ComL family)